MTIVLQTTVEDIQVTVKQVAQSTHKNPILAKMLQYVKTGWPNSVDTSMQPYFQSQNELTVEEDCLLRGMRVIVPPDLQQNVISLLHEIHPGVVKMKAIAQSYVWWPGINSAIEECSRGCLECQQTASEDPKTPLHPLEYPARPWQRIYINFAGPFQNSMWLIVVDAYSKWPEVIRMTTTTATKTVHKLQLIFARWGLLQQIVSDNGPQCSGEVFANFCRSNGIKHVRVAPYHVRSNGLAERFVQIFKKSTYEENESRRGR